MAKNIKTINITIKASKDAFTSFFRHLKGEKEKDYNFSEISALRQLLNNEKARILHVIKHEKPFSLYALARILKRDFRSVQKDAKLLEHFAFIRLVPEKSGKRNRLKPVVSADSVNIIFNI